MCLALQKSSSNGQQNHQRAPMHFLFWLTITDSDNDFLFVDLVFQADLIQEFPSSYYAGLYGMPLDNQ